MSNTKTVMGQAANTQGIPLDITDVFSTYLYTGNSASQPINNGVDLNGEGGMVWLKARTSAYNNIIVDSVRGSSNGTAYNPLFTNLTNAENTAAGYGVTSFNSNGFTLGPSGQQVISNQGGASYGDINYASWTFRKAPKFFDVVTYTGDGAAGREIAHNLGSVPGFIVVKKTNASGDWVIQHRSLGAQGSGNIRLNSTDAAISNGQHYWGDGTVGIDPTSSVFTVDNHTWVNNSGDTYVAYLFAHNNGDGEFGPSGDQDIIKCGSYTGDGSTNGPEIDLGFEPQWVLIKETSATGNWQLFDSMRGMVADGSDARIAPNLNSAEDSIQSLTPTATGFKINTTSGNMNTNNSNHIYMAIRRGPLAQPESGTEVFAVKRHAGADGPQPAGITSDMLITTNSEVANTERFNFNRLTNGKVLYTSQTFAEGNYSAYLNFGTNNGVNTTGLWGNTSVPLYYHFKRAPGFFDVVAYTGDGTSGSYTHNLGVIPELKIIKNRGGQFWVVGGSAVTGGTATGYLVLNTNAAKVVTVGEDYWGSLDSDTTFSVRAGNGASNLANANFIAYLFATVPGVSKVGSYTGNSTGNASGITQTIDCGFTSGARFVLIKKTNGTGSWVVFDTERGIISGNDPYLKLDETAAESTVTDAIDPHSSGFTLTSSTLFNGNGDTFIFYAIA